MLKKTSIALTSAGILSLAAVRADHLSASQISACDFELGTCTGFYYEDIGAAFVDCYDANGVLASRKEAFYTSPLQKECETTDGAAFLNSLNGTNAAVPTNITEVADIEVCDYYTYGLGYLFSQANSGLGLVVLGDRYNSTRDLFYQNGMPEDNTTDNTTEPSVPTMPQLNWNWAELSGLITQLQNIQCGVNNATTNVTTPIELANFNLFAALNLPWAEWGQQALLNLDFNSWTKEDLKMWLENYVMYWNAIQRYVSEAEALLVSIQGGLSGATTGLFGSYEEQIRAGIEQAKEILSQGASFIGDNIEIDGTLVFTQIWKAEFDLDTVSVGDIKNDLNIVSNVVIQIQEWFTNFFVDGGIDAILGQNTTFMIEGENGEVTNILTGTGENTVTLTVPSQVEAIVAWITANFNAELTTILAQYNVTFTDGVNINIDVEVDNSTEMENSTDNSTEVDNETEVDNSTEVDNGTDVEEGTGSETDNDGSLSLFVNYVLPDSCMFTDESNSTVRCESGNFRGVSFTIAEVSEFFNTSALEVCTDFADVSSGCANQDILALDTCLGQQLFNKFNMVGEAVFYGWLSYDVVARQTLFGRCQVESNDFSVESEQFSTGFTFNFPDIN